LPSTRFSLRPLRGRSEYSVKVFENVSDEVGLVFQHCAVVFVFERVFECFSFSFIPSNFLSFQFKYLFSRLLGHFNAVVRCIGA